MTAHPVGRDDLDDLTEEDAEAHVHGVCFKTGPPERTGVELEWLVQERSDPRALISVDRLDAALAPVEAPGALPRGSRLTREPGGQVELSSPPARGLGACVEAMAADLAAARQALDEAGLVLVGKGLDPLREPPRVLDHPRYRAMESFFDREGPWGRTMMRRTASLQINLDSGEEGDGAGGYRARWELAHRIGPVLVAAFANSPFRSGRPTGWLSTRQATWARMDPGRTRHPRHHAEPRAAWTRYALDARVLCIRDTDADAGGTGPGGGGDWSAPPGLTFRGWLRGAHPGLRRPTTADLDYHLSTLFPPVRPRGWLELRMIDAQDGDGWIVPTVLAATLLDDPLAADAARAATEPLCAGAPLPAEEVWARASRDGLADPELGRAARACFAAAESALARAHAPAPLRAALSAFAERYPDRGRCPAHDQLDALSRA
ncbi:ergothioneine biosynthesis glutamate--cysteine ligase EgtA [Actinacidiphila sp. DG2A-62]|jgi:glutamate--cysteine ligase|uniref:ergothioneine biosynthesis glutamate--cysteine ligase EgtA n=1 Tax=Actinacidiphila sp. DG2A-62 TaxID=3108821 RepID=UPI002DBA812B|nr:ergothioneine biosynthesis glutamate--cysteine ligase EgtA [Actinacidiphila sp. DG2A-62]MEC3996333.1 ergothioneine biosynthesis glutamate--cysteine ligase EgtA [Actinacidiphila sp. DG2A-62]